jgi:hypothetical protein
MLFLDKKQGTVSRDEPQGETSNPSAVLDQVPSYTCQSALHLTKLDMLASSVNATSFKSSRPPRSFITITAKHPVNLIAFRATHLLSESQYQYIMYEIDIPIDVIYNFNIS